MVTFLSHFTPSMMSEDVIERIFVQRKQLANRLVTLVRESVLGTAKHHTLIVGPRGIGKTHLASLIYHRVRGMPELANRMRVAWLREEEWGIASFLDFVIRVLHALDEGYSEAGLAGRIESLFALKAEHAEREAVALLDEFVGARTVFLITENLDQLFEGLDDVGQQQFRAYLQDRATWTILATAPGLFNGISLQSSPFYGFFRVRHLKELSVDEAVELLQKIAELSGRDELASFVRTPIGRARIRAVHHLAGGNHRIYVIFSEFLTRETLDDLVDPFLTTMDHLTPYYQARMQSLSPQMRKIVDYLCEVRHAVPVKEIAQRCFITQQTASSQLKLLKERGFVRSFVIGRESHYELMEPLLRLSLEVKKQRGEPIRLFVDFLRFWYTKPELEQRLLTTQITNPVDRDYFRQALQEWNTTNPVGEARLTEWFEAYARSFANQDFDSALEFAESLVRARGEMLDYMIKATCFGAMGEPAKALECAQQAQTLFPGHPAPTLVAGIAQHQLGNYSDAERSLDPSAFDGELPAFAWELRGQTLDELGRSDEALAAFRSAIASEPENVSFRLRYASGLLKLYRYEEALEASTLDSNFVENSDILSVRADALMFLGRYEESVMVLKTAVRLNETSRSRARLAVALTQSQRYEEATVQFERAVELDPHNPAVWLQYSWLHAKLGQFGVALEAAHRAETLNPASGEIQMVIATYLEQVGRSEEALERYQKSITLNYGSDVPHFRIAVTLAAIRKWRRSLSALAEATARVDKFTGDAGASEEILKHWLINRSPQSWEELSAVADMYAERGAIPLLSAAVVKSVAALIDGRSEPSAARAWVDIWQSFAETRPGLDVGVRLLRAGVEYHITGDPRHLLELAAEERSMVESMPGIRPLSELSQ
jgi:tetratricopeptide (TPR) repeat protein